MMTKEISTKRNEFTLLAIFVSNAIVFGSGYLSIYIFEQYGWSIFMFLPFFLGYLPVLFTKKFGLVSKRRATGIAVASLFLIYFEMLVFAAEGFICLAMASPLVIALVWVGALVARIQVNKRKTNNKVLAVVFPVIIALSFGFDTQNKPAELIPVHTAIYVNAPIETVWQNVVTFDTIKAPTDWLFKTGIAYPENATIVGTGVGAMRYCNFTTGSFVEPITTWNEPELLQFDVVDQPVPMDEFNPFYDIHPPHLNGYFASQKGEFRLTKMPNGTTKLEGTTWYKLKIYPVAYWGKWSDFIIHRIHLRVLNHIKIESENTPPAPLKRGGSPVRKSHNASPLERG